MRHSLQQRNVQDLSAKPVTAWSRNGSVKTKNARPPLKQETRRTPRNFLRFRIVPRQNAVELGDARPYLRKRTGANFGEPWRHAWTRAHAYLRLKPRKANPKIYGRAGEARKKTAVRAEFMPEDIHLFTAKRRRAIVEWCDQVPVLGFNCGRYDLNLIKEHFAEGVGERNMVFKQGQEPTASSEHTIFSTVFWSPGIRCRISC